MIAAGYKADINLIDMEALALPPPVLVQDLPAQRSRLLRTPRGIRLTIKPGTVTFEDAQWTGKNSRPTDTRRARQSRTMIDLIVRGGLIYDGSGKEPYDADVAVEGGRITAIGQVQARAREEIDARDHIVTPGFIDIHSHYDGHVTWENRLSPSSMHGVTTVVMGNCGVGYAPCRRTDRRQLIELMEGVEDLPELVMSAGLPWAVGARDMSIANMVKAKSER